MKYKIFPTGAKYTVYEGHLKYGDWIQDRTVFVGSLSDCYAFVKCKEENLYGI